LEAFLHADKGLKAKTEEELKKIIDQVFAFSFAWGLGGSLTQTSKDKFD